MQTDATNAIAEMMNAWNTIEARVRAAYPDADKEPVYRITAAAVTKAGGAAQCDCSPPQWGRVGVYEVYVWQGPDAELRAQMQFRGWNRMGRPECESIRVANAVRRTERRDDER